MRNFYKGTGTEDVLGSKTYPRDICITTASRQLKKIQNKTICIEIGYIIYIKQSVSTVYLGKVP